MPPEREMDDGVQHEHQQVAEQTGRKAGGHQPNPELDGQCQVAVPVALGCSIARRPEGIRVRISG